MLQVYPGNQRNYMVKWLYPREEAAHKIQVNCFHKGKNQTSHHLRKSKKTDGGWYLTWYYNTRKVTVIKAFSRKKFNRKQRNLDVLGQKEREFLEAKELGLLDLLTRLRVQLKSLMLLMIFQTIANWILRKKLNKYQPPIRNSNLFMQRIILYNYKEILLWK